MYATTLSVASLLAATALGSTLPRDLVKRSPSDQSGTSSIVLGCNGVTVPMPGGAGGAGEGGFAYFSTSLKFSPDGGDAIQPTACTEDSSTCANCLFEYDGLSSATNVTACWNPPGGQAGCSIAFDYNGYSFDSQAEQPYCGHENGFAAFSFDLAALCYFNLTGTAGA
ncbi:hypothetical protein GGR57DRAFT_508472 [Xylariaceae sp. FL1272]|nr:hypothetical protein GGR57DRAFT_508472 [Xylariaceae sp. FL1272]